MKNKDQTKCSIEAIKLRQTAELNAKYGAAAPILMYHGEHCRRAPAPAPVKAGYEPRAADIEVEHLDVNATLASLRDGVYIGGML